MLIRTLALASTTRGFAFAVVDGQEGLLATGNTRNSIARPARGLERVLDRFGPYAVVVEELPHSTRKKRGKLFVESVRRCCQERGLLMIEVEIGKALALCNLERPTKWDLVSVLLSIFPELEPKRPQRRLRWTAEDDRIGIFVAVAIALVAWV